MTDLDIMKHAQEYIEKMSKGINPLSDEPVPDGDLIKQEKISQCLTYVSGILSDVIDKRSIEEFVPRRRGRKPFEISDEKKQLLVPLDHDAYLKEIVDVIKSVANESGHYKFQAKWINDYFLYIGFLTMKGKYKVSTKDGEMLGIISHLKTSETIGEYYVNTYSPDAQQFIFDNIDSIIEYANDPNSLAVIDDTPTERVPNTDAK